jgi:outer membrane protein
MKKIAAIFALAITMCTAAMAQTQKIGYINSKDILALMPEMKKAEADLQTYGKQFKDQYESMQKEGEKKVAEYQANAKTMTDAVRTVKENELQDLQKRMAAFEQTTQEKMEAKQNEILKPIYDKVTKAINDVAKEKGYTFVFDPSVGGILYAAETENLLAAVKLKLGIK